MYKKEDNDPSRLFKRCKRANDKYTDEEEDTMQSVYGENHMLLTGQGVNEQPNNLWIRRLRLKQCNIVW